MLFLVASVVLLHWKAKQIVIELLKANTSGRVEVQIGSLKIIPIKNTIDIQDVSVRIRDPDSDRQTDASVKKIFIDVVSLWDFFSGGTLVIEKLQCDGGMIILPVSLATNKDTTNHKTQSLAALIKKVKSDAVRFKIQEMAFNDFNLTQINEDDKRPSEIKHLNVTAHNLHLSADSILKIRPLIEFSLPHQTILLPAGISLAFDTLFFSTNDNSIQVEKLKLISPDSTSSNQFEIYSEKIRLAHFDFENLYTQGIATIDSVFLDRSMLNIQRRQGDSNTTTNSSGLDLVLPFHIKHLIINELAASLKLSKGAIQNSYTIKNSSLTLEDFWHKPDSTHKISTKNFDLVITEYNTLLSQHSTSISFDTVRLQKHSLSLLNFRISSPHQKLPLLQTEVFQLNQVDWYSVLFDKKLIAEEVIVQNPTVHSTIKPAVVSTTEPKDNLLLKSLKDFLEVRLFTLTNATAYLRLQEQQADIVLQGGHATLHFADLIRSTNPNEAWKSIDRVSFKSLIIKSPDLTGSINKFDIHQGSLYVKNASIQAKEKLIFSSSDLLVQKISWNHLVNKLNLSGVSWKSMDVAIIGGRDQHESDDPKKLPNISIANLIGENSSVGYTTRAANLNTLLPIIKIKSLQLGDTIRFSGVDIQGHTAHFESSANTGSVGSFQFTDQSVDLNKVVLNRQTADTLFMTIEKLTIEADLQGLAQKRFWVKQLALKNIKTNYSKFDSLQHLKINLENNLVLNKINYNNKKLTIGSLALEAGPIDLKHNKKISLREEIIGDKSKPNLRNANMGIDTLIHRMDTSSRFKLRELNNSNSTTTYNPLYSTNALRVQSKQGGINLSVTDITASMLDSTMQLTANINAVQLHDILFSTNKLTAQITSGSVQNMVIHSVHVKAPLEIIRDNFSTLAISNLKASIETGGNLIQFNRMDYDPVMVRGSIKDFEFRPIKDKQVFLDESFYQTNFIHTKIDSISINKLNIEKFLNDSLFHVSSIHLSAPSLDVHRDKTHPFFPGKIKLLPTNAIQQLGVKIRIDTIQFEEGKIRYTEKSRITGKEGSIYFTDLNGRVRNIKSTGISSTDSLYIRASTRFLDSARVNLRVRESYHDTLGGFLMTTSVSPFHTSILNPSLIPMVSVDFESGFIDTLQMRAVGREYVSIGSMKMLYRDLKVNFLDKEDTSKHSVKNVILKFAANNFVIKTNNTNRIGKVYFERDRHRAVFQYWIKMILSGVTTSVGAKSNKKQIKKYMKQLNQKKLPPIDQELIDL